VYLRLVPHSVVFLTHGSTHACSNEVVRPTANCPHKNIKAILITHSVAQDTVQWRFIMHHGKEPSGDIRGQEYSD